MSEMNDEKVPEKSVPEESAPSVEGAATPQRKPRTRRAPAKKAAPTDEAVTQPLFSSDEVPQPASAAEPATVASAAEPPAPKAPAKRPGRKPGSTSRKKAEPTEAPVVSEATEQVQPAATPSEPASAEVSESSVTSRKPVATRKRTPRKTVPVSSEGASVEPAQVASEPAQVVSEPADQAAESHDTPVSPDRQSSPAPAREDGRGLQGLHRRQRRNASTRTQAPEAASDDQRAEQAQQQSSQQQAAQPQQATQQPQQPRQQSQRPQPSQPQMQQPQPQQQRQSQPSWQQPSYDTDQRQPGQQRRNGTNMPNKGRSLGNQNNRNNGQNNRNNGGGVDAAGNRRRQHRGNVAEPVAPQITKEELAELKVTELRDKAEELNVDLKEIKKKEDLVDAVYVAALKAEGFVPVEGLLDVLPEGYGFIRTSGYLPSEGDAYVGMNAIKRNGLRKGDYIVGQLRPARENEKYAAVHRIDTVNGLPLSESAGRVKFADLTPVYPDESYVMEHGRDFITARTIDLVAPIGKGQRGLIVSPPKAGKTTILKDIAASISANNPEAHLMCLLVDERPEEVTDMQRSIKGEVISSTFDMPCENHIAVAELVIERAKRLVEAGDDVVILLDSITRLARAYNLAQPASGRILSGGVDSTALYPPKRFLGAARNIENGGSLTIIASALIDTGSKMDEVIFEEFKGTGNMELKLDRSLADRRIFPAIDPVASGTRKEELLIDPQMAPFVWGVRRILANMNNTERAMEMLIKSLKQTEDNREFLIRTARKAQEKNGIGVDFSS